MITNDARCTRKIESRIAMAKAAFNKIFFSAENWRLYGAETWELQGVGQKHVENFGLWCWRRMEKISWTDCVRNGIKEGRDIIFTV
jgi:hypothetical protein